ncbi:MAG: tetratricopeptide repeat protein [Candidatus Hydrogenedentota bacterium]|nr:MAG: tetratricopeptide repeat protein [Candidatus Hydrogenedentota bacterium]
MRFDFSSPEAYSRIDGKEKCFIPEIFRGGRDFLAPVQDSGRCGPREFSAVVTAFVLILFGAGADTTPIILPPPPVVRAVERDGMSDTASPLESTLLEPPRPTIRKTPSAKPTPPPLPKPSLDSALPSSENDTPSNISPTRSIDTNPTLLPPESPSAAPSSEIRATHLLPTIPERVPVNQPFTVTLQAVDRWGAVDTTFQERVFFECILGVIPVASSRLWNDGVFSDSVVIPKPGRKILLRIRAGGLSVARHVDVFLPKPVAQDWERKAERLLRARKIPEAIAALEKASRAARYEDAEIERKIARLYLRLEKFDQARIHYEKALAISLRSARGQGTTARP